jgi:hypothetical protein
MAFLIGIAFDAVVSDSSYRVWDRIKRWVVDYSMARAETALRNKHVY